MTTNLFEDGNGGLVEYKEGMPLDVTPANDKGPMPRYIKSNIRKHALKVSGATRNGKFERVSQEFIESVIAECESKLMLMKNSMVNSAFGVVDSDVTFLTGEGKKRLCEAFEIWVAREIQRKVNNVRIGKTL
jgi:hypothetical protein